MENDLLSNINTAATYLVVVAKQSNAEHMRLSLDDEESKSIGCVYVVQDSPELVALIDKLLADYTEPSSEHLTATTNLETGEVHATHRLADGTQENFSSVTQDEDDSE